MQTPPLGDMISDYIVFLKNEVQIWLLVLNDWPNYIVNAKSVNSFKSLLDFYLIVF